MPPPGAGPEGLQAAASPTEGGVPGQLAAAGVGAAEAAEQDGASPGDMRASPRGGGSGWSSGRSVRLRAASSCCVKRGVVLAGEDANSPLVRLSDSALR
mmetsp:Transcript_15522/g.42886  ORF Transcript_15522/g.42886 Transcript_15522/m.42886 type:complete len:99 (+) Transcript_15522:1578-1874(+)